MSAALAPGAAIVHADSAETTDWSARLAPLIAAYPVALDRVEGRELIWRDGSRMTVTDGIADKTSKTRIETADVKDMLIEAYPAHSALTAPAADSDPGRARNAAFFNKLYGDCSKGEVEPTLVDVMWLPKKFGKILKVSPRHGAAQRLQAVSARLDQLPAKFDAYLFPPAGTYNCRVIAGTERVSAHGHGIAIDLNVKNAHYWRWTNPNPSGPIPYRNAFPPEIIAAFEAEGFIWGGRWYHYDTMHFEYRPELVAPVGPVQPVAR
jgi:hypothetical protein